MPQWANGIRNLLSMPSGAAAMLASTAVSLCCMRSVGASLSRENPHNQGILAYEVTLHQLLTDRRIPSLFRSLSRSAFVIE